VLLPGLELIERAGLFHKLEQQAAAETLLDFMRVGITRQYQTYRAG
jgi:hypothetical protein